MINQQFKNKYLKYKNKYYKLINKHKKLKGGSAVEIVSGLSGILLIIGTIIYIITSNEEELKPKEIFNTSERAAAVNDDGKPNFVFDNDVYYGIYNGKVYKLKIDDGAPQLQTQDKP